MRDDGGSRSTSTPALRASSRRPAPPEVATWARRLAATVLDNLMLAGVAFLVTPVLDGEPISVLSPELPFSSGAWTSPWTWVVVAVMLLTQAYLGSTPAKLVLGIAVVGVDHGRPIGLLRTVGRTVAHVLDLILYVGYLRPLWHPWRQTYADSLASTVVLRTRSPLAHPWVATLEARGRRRPDLLPGVVTTLRAPVETGDRHAAAPGALLLTPTRPAPRWRTRASVVAGVLCATGAGFAVGPVTQSPEPTAFAACDVADPPTTPIRLVSGSVALQTAEVTDRRLGVERTSLTGRPEGVHVSFGWDGEVPEHDVLLRVRLVGTDGGPVRTFDHVSTQGVIQPGVGTPVGDTSTEVLLPPSVLDGLGDAWSWETSLLLDGRELGSCAGGTPAPLR